MPFRAPQFVRSMKPPYLPELDAEAAPVRGIMPQVVEVGKRILAVGGAAFSQVYALLTDRRASL